MRRSKKLDQEKLKMLNRQMVLNYIGRCQQVSRIEISHYTGLSPTTVSIISSELISQGIVIELGVGESSGGRRPVMLGINPKARYSISVVIKPKEIIYALIDLKCNIIYMREREAYIDGAEELKDILRDCIGEILCAYRDMSSSITGIGISLPGILSQNKRILYSAPLKVVDFNIIKFLREDVYEGQYYLFKDTDAYILGEYNFGLERQFKNIVYMIIEDGIGMSYLQGGKLFKPSNSGGFELGHVKIDPNGPMCRCGSRGCIGVLLSEDGMVNEYREKSGKLDRIIRFKDIIRLSNEGDSISKDILSNQACILGMGVANIVNMLNPELIIIGGPLKKCTWDYLDIVHREGQRLSLKGYRENISIQYAKLDVQAAIIGMANAIYGEEIFKPVGI